MNQTPHPRYPNVFSPIQVGPITLPNRYYFSPHGLPLTVGCGPSNDLVAYATERVRDGGCGLMILSCTAHERGRHFQPCPYPADSVPAFGALARAIHEAGGKVFAQLWYWWGANGHWQPLGPQAPLLGPSASQYGYRGVTASTHALSKIDIARMRDAFRQSVRHLREAGFDGIEIHGSHGGLVEQFLSPYFNRRTDEYGGSLENRMRFLLETLDVARDAAGASMAVGLRFNCNELVPGGYGNNEAREVLRTISERGLIDFADLDVAIEPNQLELGMPTVFVPEHNYRSDVQAVRSAAGAVPVLSVLGRVTRMQDAEAAIASGLCDMVGSTRQLIAEPRFVQLARTGKERDARICIACNWCLAGMGDGAFGCAINPASYRERLWGVDTFSPAAKKSRVVIVGGGPGGLEAARVAALKGHEVTLFESRPVLGGALAQWATLPGREFYAHAIDWWVRELDRLGVELHLAHAATAQDVLALKPDAVIVATGATFSRSGRSAHLDQDIPGADSAYIYSADDILEGARPVGKVVLLDGEGTQASSGIAELLARGGAQVSMLFPTYQPFSQRVYDALESQFVAQRLHAAGVKLMPTTWVREFRERDVHVVDVVTGHQAVLEQVDAVVLVTSRLPVDGLARELESKVSQLFTIGDALSVRPLATAAYEGHRFARLIGEPDAPRTMGESYFRPTDPDTYPTPARH